MAPVRGPERSSDRGGLIRALARARTIFFRMLPRLVDLLLHVFQALLGFSELLLGLPYRLAQLILCHGANCSLKEPEQISATVRRPIDVYITGGPSPADPGKGGHGGGSPRYLIPSARARNVQAGVRSVGNTSPLPRPAVLTLAGGVHGFARVFAGQLVGDGPWVEPRSPPAAFYLRQVL
jgi:hypothetical protein